FNNILFMTSIELSDVQGLIINDYDDMRYSRYVMLQIIDAAAARKFLNDITDSVTHAGAVGSNNRMNIAFTSKGLKTLGLKEGNIQTFVREFREGMVTPHRQRLLGDFDSSDPSAWEWGGP